MKTLLQPVAALAAIFVPSLWATPEFSTVLVGAGILNCAGAQNGIFSVTPVNHSLTCSGTTPVGTDFVTENSLLKARADFLSLGSYIDYTITTSSGVTVSNLGIQSIARGADQIIVTGGTGNGVLRTSITLSGQPVVQDAPLQVNIFWGFSWTNSVGVNSFSTGTLTADIPFTYGVPFTISRILSVSVTGNATAGSTQRGLGDFFGSATFQPFQVLDTGLNPVSGATVASDAFTYEVADAGASVPEPSTSLALLTGTGTLILLQRRIAQR